MSERPLQTFSDDYLARVSKASATEIAQFLEDFRLMHAPDEASKLISIRMPGTLLSAFKQKCELEGTKYQTKIKILMRAWLSE